MTIHGRGTPIAKTTRIDSLLATLHQRVPAAKGAIVATADGLVLASLLPSGAQSDRLAAMIAAALPLAEELAAEMPQGSFDELRVMMSDGAIHLRSVGPRHILAVATQADHPSPPLMTSLRQFARALSHLLEAG